MKHNFKNSIKRMKVYCIYPHFYSAIFLPFWWAKISSFIIFIRFREFVSRSFTRVGLQATNSLSFFCHGRMSWFPLHSLRIYLLPIQFCIESSFLSALEKCAISFYPPWFWMRRNPPSFKLFSLIGSVFSPGYFQDHFFALVFRCLTMVTLACISWGLSCLRFASAYWICRFLHACVLSHFSCVQLYLSLWTVACQASLSMGFSRQE